jgi:hypothetical protein
LKETVWGDKERTVSVQVFSSLIHRHEGDPRVWVNAVFEHSENPESELSIAIQEAPSSDRYYTARALSNSLSRYQMDNVAYMQVYGGSADSYRLEGFRQGQEFLNMIIQALDSI